MIKRISLYLMIILYLAAGVNHFIHPGSYYPIIPDYLPYHAQINILAGIAELVLGILLIFPVTRKVAAYGIIVLLVLFVPAHIYMIQKSGCMNETMCWQARVAWVRLFPLQFVLMWWAWWHRK